MASPDSMSTQHNALNDTDNLKQHQQTDSNPTEAPAIPTGSHSQYTHHQTSRFNLRAFMTESISPESKLTTVLLLLLALATGINDAATVIGYRIFVSNQTGNTVFLGVGTFDKQSGFDLRNVGLSLGGFLFGGLMSGQVAQFISSKRTRWFVVASNLLQTVLTLAAAGLRHWYAVPPAGVTTESDTHKSFSVVVFLAVASGLQVAMARGLGVAEIPTAMITSAWIDLVADEKIWYFWKRNRARDRRSAFVLCILVGGFVGSATHVYATAALPLLLAGIVKVVVTLGFAFQKGEKLKEKNKEAGDTHGQGDKSGKEFAKESA